MNSYDFFIYEFICLMNLLWILVYQGSRRSPAATGTLRMSTEVRQKEQILQRLARPLQSAYLYRWRLSHCRQPGVLPWQVVSGRHASHRGGSSDTRTWKAQLRVINAHSCTATAAVTSSAAFVAFQSFNGICFYWQIEVCASSCTKLAYWMH